MDLRNKVKNSRWLYCCARLIKNRNDRDLYDLLQGYYENIETSQSFLVKHKGCQNSEYFIYYISLGVQSEDQAGLYGMLRGILDYLFVADKLDMIPVVHIGEKTLYYDESMNNRTLNVFEYFFEPVSSVPFDLIEECANIVEARKSHMRLFINNPVVKGNYYLVSEDMINRWAVTYKKYIRLNKDTADYVNMGIKKSIGNKKTLGVHIRGTDFNAGYKNHPKIIAANDYIKTVKEMKQKGKFDQIFLATDDSKSLAQFKNAFGDQIIYYKDVLRTEGEYGVHTIQSDRDLHHYKLGLEVIRDVYTLAMCDGLVAGPSYVAFACRFVKKSMDREYEFEEILSNGIYLQNSTRAMEIEHKLSRKLQKNI